MRTYRLILSALLAALPVLPALSSNLARPIRTGAGQPRTRDTTTASASAAQRTQSQAQSQAQAKPEAGGANAHPDLPAHQAGRRCTQGLSLFQPLAGIPKPHHGTVQARDRQGRGSGSIGGLDPNERFKRHLRPNTGGGVVRQAPSRLP